MESKKPLGFTQMRQFMSQIFRKIPEFRQRGKLQISLHDGLMSGFACMFFKDPSLLQFQERLKDAERKTNLETLFDVKNIPKSSQMREIIDQVDSKYFKVIYKNLYSRLQRGKHLKQYQLFDGIGTLTDYYYFPIDGTTFFSSDKLNCGQCLTQERKNGGISYSHQVLLGGIAHPDMAQVIPFIPEEICNSDGASKQDCEMNAAKRYLKNLRKDFSRLKLVVGGDALFAKQPIIKQINADKNMKYIFMVKPDSHKYLMDWVNAYDELNKVEFTDERGQTHVYERMNDVPLCGEKDAVRTNFFRCSVIGRNEYILDTIGKKPKRLKSKGTIGLYQQGDEYRAMVRSFRGILKDISMSDVADIDTEMLDSLPWVPKKKIKAVKGRLAQHIIKQVINHCDHTRDEIDKEMITFKATWVTSIEVTEENIKTMVSAGRCRWKNENEMFNVMKNHGYEMEHNYGHGENNLCFNFYLFTLLAFFFHQIFELTDPVYQENRKKFGSKCAMWEALKNYIRIIPFESCEVLLAFALNPKAFEDLRLIPKGQAP